MPFAPGTAQCQYLQRHRAACDHAPNRGPVVARPKAVGGDAPAAPLLHALQWPSLPLEPWRRQIGVASVALRVETRPVSS